MRRKKAKLPKRRDRLQADEVAVFVASDPATLFELIYAACGSDPEASEQAVSHSLKVHILNGPDGATLFVAALIPVAKEGLL